MNPVQHYLKRYEEIKREKEISADFEVLADRIENDNAGLNNFFMAAFGMSTLILRLGAVIQMCRKFESLDEYGDALFTKQVLDNLCETLPSDTSWKNLWNISAVDEDWKRPTLQPKGGQSLLERFVTFRNKFVHQNIQLSKEYIPQLYNSIGLFEEIAALDSLFEKGNLTLIEGKYHWAENNETISLYPYVQGGKEKDHPYIFQGLHKSQEKVAILNLIAGNEEAQASNIHLEPVFEPMRSSLQGGAGQAFDHSERIAYYQSCFVGRGREKSAVVDFCSKSDVQNILCVKSPAGMGKGALIADVIQQLKENKTQVLYHFCGAGMQNSLHATLYHLIIQGKEYWNRSDESLDRKLNRLPSKFIDVIHLFQSLLSKENLKLNAKNKSGNLVIIIDGLDEAQVAYSQLKISDWFYTYNEKEEPEEDWRSETNIRWVFTYRCEDDGKESFFQFPKMKELVEIPLLQPLTGLSPEAVDEVFSDFKVSEEFKQGVIKNSEIKNLALNE